MPKTKSRKKTKLNTYCDSCHKQQYEQNGTITCPRGHDGLFGITKRELEKRIEAKRKFSGKRAIHIQIGDDEGEEADLYYRLIHVGGPANDFILRAYKREEVLNKTDDKYETKETMLKSYVCSLHWACRKILQHELATVDAVSVQELLDGFNRIEAKLEKLTETLFYISEEDDE